MQARRCLQQGTTSPTPPSASPRPSRLTPPNSHAVGLPSLPPTPPTPLASQAGATPSSSASSPSSLAAACGGNAAKANVAHVQDQAWTCTTYGGTAEAGRPRRAEVLDGAAEWTR